MDIVTSLGPTPGGPNFSRAVGTFRPEKNCSEIPEARSIWRPCRPLPVVGIGNDGRFWKDLAVMMP